jgi:hypothetical protein
MPRLHWLFIAWVAALLGLSALASVASPGLARTSVHAVAGASSALCNGARLRGVLGIIFTPAQGVDREWWADVMLVDTQTGALMLVSTLDVKGFVYAPVTLFLALMLATPGRLTRAWAKAMGLGLALTTALAVTSIAVAVTCSLAHLWVIDPGRDALALLTGCRSHLVELGPTGTWLLGALDNAMGAMRYPVSAVIWILAIVIALPRQVDAWLRPVARVFLPGPRSTRA